MKKTMLLLADRVKNWWNDAWLAEKKQTAKSAGVHQDWQFLRERLYHRLPERILQTVLAYGKPEPRPNETHKGQMDMQYTLEGEMQFANLHNPWKPGKQRQPGFYHMTRGIDGKIYHVGFKAIPNRGFQLSDFIPEEHIPVEWADKDTQTYSAVFDPSEAVRHVLYLKQ